MVVKRLNIIRLQSREPSAHGRAVGGAAAGSENTRNPDNHDLDHGHHHHHHEQNHHGIKAVGGGAAGSKKHPES